MKKYYDVKKHYELMTFLASDSYASSNALLINISIVAFVFWDTSSHILLTLWLGALVSIITVRTLLAKKFLQKKLTLAIDKIEQYFKILTLSSAVILICGIVSLFPNTSPYHQAFLTMVVAGLSAGAVMSLSYYKDLIRNYLLILLVPFILTTYFYLHEMHLPLSFLILLFLVMLIIFAKKYNTNIMNNLHTKYIVLQTQKELQNSEKNFSSIFQEVPIGVLTYNEDLQIVQANKAFAKLLHAPMNKLLQLNMKKLKDQSVRPSLEKVFQGKKGFYEGEYNTHISNKKIFIRMHTVPMYDTDGKIVYGLGIVEDITDFVKAQEALRYQAFYDSLTGLANRATLHEHLERFTNKLIRSQQYGALLFIDLDNFKDINDSLGHDIGDIVLQVFAQRIKAALRKEDIISRLGGDEFVILLAQTHKDITQINKTALNVANKIHQIMKEPISTPTTNLHITLSLGIKTLQPHETDTTTILKHADIAMYQSKNAGKNKTSFYDDQISTLISEQLTLHNELKLALVENQFELYLQPIVNAQTDTIVSAEALIRWNHPTKGLIFPDQFIEYAEKNDLIIDIGAWVIKKAFELYKELHTTLDNITINISSKQFAQEDFVSLLLENLHHYHAEASFIKLELTESIAVENLQHAITKMLLLKTNGFQLSMDDFGTGYSSLSYLKNLPFDYIKIDQSFVRNALTNENDKRLVKIITDISKEFHFLVIAEGVETQAHVDFIKESGCDFYQGYFISKPLPLAEFKKLLT